MLARPPLVGARARFELRAPEAAVGGLLSLAAIDDLEARDDHPVDGDASRAERMSARVRRVEVAEQERHVAGLGHG
jgi:hypothetical protein